MSENQKDLLLVQIGPVQEFISAARELFDLRSGSYLIAYLTAIGIKHVEDHGGTIIFPCLDNQTIYQRLFNPKLELGQPTLPNRFCAEVPHDQVKQIAEGAKEAVRNEFKKISARCFISFSNCFPKSAGLFKDRWNDQVGRFLQISWQAVPLTDKWGDSYGKLLRNLAARRNTRDFQQYAHDASRNGTAKDALNGQDEIVINREEWKQVQQSCHFFTKRDKLSDAILYGAISIIKRLWMEEYLEDVDCRSKFPFLDDLTKETNGECPKYVAAIQMDGDHMGAILSNPEKDREFFTRFSAKLANFTRDEAKQIIERYSGRLIYAGGDDVLAIVPACYAVDCARKLRKKFCEDSPKMPGSETNLCKESPKATLSAGIAFGHHKTPIARLLAEARNAEHRAKEHYGRDALAITIVKRSGEIAEWGAKFDSSAWPVFKQFQQLSSKDEEDKSVLSSRFAYALASRMREYLPEYKSLETDNPELIQGIVWEEFRQVCGRQRDEKVQIPAKFESDAGKYLSEIFGHETVFPWEFPQLFLCANFLMRKNEDEN